MTENRPDFTQMAQAAREARERQEAEAQEALTRQLEGVAGEAHFEFEELFGRTDLDHETKMARYRAATAALRGEGAAPAATPAPSEPLSPKTTEIITLILSDEDRFVLEPFGALKDRRYPRLKKEYEASLVPATPAAAPASTPGGEPSAPAPAEPAQPASETPSEGSKNAKRKKKAATPTPEPEPPAEKPGLLRRTFAAAQAAAENAKDKNVKGS